jgi:hypothetical protein
MAMCPLLEICLPSFLLSEFGCVQEQRSQEGFHSHHLDTYITVCNLDRVLRSAQIRSEMWNSKWSPG